MFAGVRRTLCVLRGCVLFAGVADVHWPENCVGGRHDTSESHSQTQCLHCVSSLY